MDSPPYTYAGLGPRFFALLIDLFLFCSLFFPVTRVVKGVWVMDATDHLWVSGLFITDPLCIIFFCVMVVYTVGLEAAYGATVGKMVMRLRVIRRDTGASPGVKKAIIRNVLRAVDGLPALNLLGVLLIVRSPEHERFGDMMAGTRVVRTRSGHNLSDDVLSPDDRAR